MRVCESMCTTRTLHSSEHFWLFFQPSPQTIIAALILSSEGEKGGCVRVDRIQQGATEKWIRRTHSRQCLFNHQLEFKPWYTLWPLIHTAQNPRNLITLFRLFVVVIIVTQLNAGKSAGIADHLYQLFSLQSHHTINQSTDENKFTWCLRSRCGNEYLPQITSKSEARCGNEYLTIAQN